MRLVPGRLRVGAPKGQGELGAQRSDDPCRLQQLVLAPSCLLGCFLRALAPLRPCCAASSCAPSAATTAAQALGLCRVAANMQRMRRLCSLILLLLRLVRRPFRPLSLSFSRRREEFIALAST